jgi:hypothetical protein
MSQCVLANNDTYLTVCATNYIITVHFSALMGHLQVFPFIHYQLIELQHELHTFSLTYIGHIQPHLFPLSPYLGILISVGLLHLISKLKLLFNCWLISKLVHK